MKKRVRIIAVFLVLVLVMQLIPIGVFADDVEVSAEQTQSEQMEDTAASAASEAVADEKQTNQHVSGEMPELRGQTEKHFRMNDGSYVAVDYGAPVHFTTDEGETWENIDNTLTLSRDETNLYTSENGNAARSFAADLRSGLLFTASDGEHSLRMGLASGESADNDNAAEESSTQATDGMEPASDPGNSSEEGNLSASSVPAYNPAAAAEISYPDEKNRGTEELSLAEQLAPTKLHAQILYQNVYENVDLQYDLYSYDVKETIIVNQPLDDYSFSFSLNLDGLTPVLMDDGSIELRDADGEIIYLIPAPYMTDAAGDFSDAVSYSLEKSDSENWLLAVTADETWINAEDRAFPVSVDPTVYFAGNSSNQQIFSGYINDNSPNTHPADSSSLIRCGNYPGSPSTAGHSIGLIYVNELPSVPENCVVTTTMLKLFQAYYSNDTLSYIEGKWVYGYYNYPRLYSSQINDPSFNRSDPAAYISSVTWNQFFGNVNNVPNVYYGSGSNIQDRTTLDYTKCKYDTMGDHYFEITDAVRKWYEGDESISRLLVLDDGHNLSINSRATFSGYYNGNFGHQPQIIVFYRNTVGVEGYYDYHTQSIGRAGAASVNNFTLGLSLSVPVFSAPSLALPFGLSLTYNAPISDASFTSSASLHTKDYTTSGTGYGWKSSVQQSVVELNLMNNAGVNKPWLIYTDADGTEHYFGRKDGSTTVFEDEDGLGLTITKSTSSGVTVYTMKDKETNTWVFQNGYLTSYTDYNGNALYYAYNENNYSGANSDWMPQNANTVYRVTSVWRKNSGVNSAIKLVTLNYASNRLTSITDMANRSTSFAYDSAGNLTTITYPDGQTASYSYTNANVSNSWSNTTKTFHRMTTARDDEARYELRYSYSGRAPLRVSSVKEYSNASGSETAGMSMNFFKANATTAMFRYCGADLELNTNDDLTARVYFDNWGRPINTVSLDKDAKTMLGVSAGTYTQNADTNKDNNRLTHAASGGLQSTNQLDNSGLEAVASLSSWNANGNGTAASAASSDTPATYEVTPRTGKKMLKLFLDSYNGTESVYQNVYLMEDTTYVFSAYVNTAAALNMGTGGVYLSFRTNSGEDILDASSQILNYKTSTAVEKGWERLEAVFTPDQSGAYQVAVNMKNMKKVILADDLQLEAVPTVSGLGELGASSVNLLQLGSFELPSSAGPNSSKVNDWWSFTTYTDENNVTHDRVSIEDHETRGKIIRLHNEPYRQVRAWQTVNVNAPGSRTYLLSGWGKLPVGYTVDATKLKYNNATYERFFGFIVEIHYSGYSTPEYQYIAFNGNVGSWQYTSGVIVPEHPERTVEKLVVKITGDLLPNDALVDDVSLVQEPVQTYTYDEKGNLIAATNSEGKTSTKPDSKDRLEKYTAMNGVEYEFHYANSTTRNPDYMTTDGVKTSYEYDDSGSVKKTSVQNDSGKKLISETNYDSSKNFSVSSTDVNGSSVQSSYNTAKALLTGSTDPKGTQTHYSYNSNNDRPSQTYISGVDALNYSYDERGRLKQLRRGSYNGGSTFLQAYRFSYDTWGNTDSIRIWTPISGVEPDNTNSIELASYVYNDNGTLSCMNYPNGDYVLYSYDLLDRLVEEVYYNCDNIVKADYRYVYNANGQLAKQYAVETNSGVETVTESYVFEYDSLGRLIRSREEGDSSLVQRTEHLYDSANRLTAQNWSIGSSGFKEQYAYNSSDGTMASFSIGYTLPNGNTDTYMLNYQYDPLKRMSGAAYRYGDNTTPIYTRSYDYLDYDGDTTRTTSRLGTYTVRDGSNSLLTGNQYEYDANGNITKVKEAYLSGNTIAYRIAAEYEYDALNQLKTETRYDYSTTPVSTTTVSYTVDTAGNLRTVSGGGHIVSYTYGNSAWADLLTAVTVDGISYSISYASPGNPSNWFNENLYENLTWTQGRRLSSLTVGNSTYSYEYDMSGIRSAKVANGLRHEYVTQNGRVVRETVYALDNTTGEYTVFQYALDFTYDEAGHPLTMRRYNNANMQADYVTMQYVCNAQGDVVKLIYEGAVYAEYSYDAWGNAIIKTGSLNYENVNPLRYRGYYFDAETGFYYLQSRYYDPIVKRFINADTYASTGQGFLGYNMFAYCNNCPFAGSDPSGTAIHNNIVICNDGNNNQYGDRCEIVPREYCIGYYYDVEDAINNTEKAINKAKEYVDDNIKNMLDDSALAWGAYSTARDVAQAIAEPKIKIIVIAGIDIIFTGWALGRRIKVW